MVNRMERAHHQRSYLILKWFCFHILIMDARLRNSGTARSKRATTRSSARAPPPHL